MPDDQKPFNLEEWEKDPKHESSRSAFDQMVSSAQRRLNAKQAAEDEAKRKAEAEKLPFPFNLFSGK